MEGARPVRDLLQDQPTTIQMIVLSDHYRQREASSDRRLREAKSVPFYICQDHTFASLSGLENPEGVLAVIGQPRWNENEIFRRPEIFGLYGERVQDPANVGTIIRSAAGLNVSALWLSPDSADIYNPKVVRASSGALLCLPIFEALDTDRFARENCAIYAAVPSGQGSVHMETIKNIPQRCILALGNESRGLSEQTVQQAACRFTIPLVRHVESLNVAATAAIALYHLGHLPKQSQG